MFKFSFKIFFIFFLLLFNFSNFSLLVAEEEEELEEVLLTKETADKEEMEDNVEYQEVFEEIEDTGAVEEEKEIEKNKIEVDNTNKINLHEHGDSLVRDDDSGEKLKETLKQAKDIGRDINSIFNMLREIRNKFRVKYQDEVDRRLDELLQRVGFVSGAQTGKDRFKLLHSAVKSEYENEWGKIKSEVDEIDLLEDKVLEELKNLDSKYEIVVQLLLESRKINLEVFTVSDSNNDVLKQLQDKLLDAKKIEKEVINVLEKELYSLIAQIDIKLKKVEDDFKKLEEKGNDLDEYEDALEKSKETNENQLPKWRRAIEAVVDRSLGYYSLIVVKIKDSWNSLYLKITDFVKIFISDVREKSREIRKENSDSKVMTEKVES